MVYDLHLIKLQYYIIKFTEYEKNRQEGRDRTSKRSSSLALAALRPSCSSLAGRRTSRPPFLIPAVSRRHLYPSCSSLLAAAFLARAGCRLVLDPRLRAVVHAGRCSPSPPRYSPFLCVRGASYSVAVVLATRRALGSPSYSPAGSFAG
jgi:hypothetical protein